MKIYAKQVSPEYQESPFYSDLSDIEGINLFGNRHLVGHTSDLFDALPGILDELTDAWNDLHAGCCAWYDSWSDALADLARPQNRAPYTREERKRAWPSLLDNWDGYDKTVMCDALELITGQAWDWCTLRGCCQSEWTYCIYQVDTWSDKHLHRLEAEYFNMGTEWIVDDTGDTITDPADIVGWSIYCVAGDAEGIRAEIATAAGADIADVILYSFDGWTRSARYTEVK